MGENEIANLCHPGDFDNTWLSVPIFNIAYTVSVGLPGLEKTERETTYDHSTSNPNYLRKKGCCIILWQRFTSHDLAEQSLLMLRPHDWELENWGGVLSCWHLWMTLLLSPSFFWAGAIVPGSPTSWYVLWTGLWIDVCTDTIYFYSS